VLGATGGNDVTKGMRFEILQAVHTGDQLRFVVPITGIVDDDAILFDLKVEKGRLAGSWNELRPGSETSSVVFTR
jgi:hypothetical protein